jgi:hypothetical protein
MQRIFYKSVLSLDSQLVDFVWKGNEASILYLGRTISSKTPQAKLEDLASSKNPFGVFYILVKEILGFHLVLQ